MENKVDLVEQKTGHSSATTHDAFAEELEHPRPTLFPPPWWPRGRLGAYRHALLPIWLWDLKPLPRNLRTAYELSWEISDGTERCDRLYAAWQEYLPAEEQRAYWQEAGMVWRNAQTSAFVGGLV
jgi:hypothetical protein